MNKPSKRGNDPDSHADKKQPFYEGRMVATEENKWISTYAKDYTRTYKPGTAWIPYYKQQKEEAREARKRRLLHQLSRFRGKEFMQCFQEHLQIAEVELKHPGGIKPKERLTPCPVHGEPAYCKADKKTELPPEKAAQLCLCPRMTSADAHHTCEGFMESQMVENNVMPCCASVEAEASSVPAYRGCVKQPEYIQGRKMF